MAKHKGRFPNKCPNCKSKDLQYGDFDNYGATGISQVVRCNLCDEEYLEFFKAVGWQD